MGWKGALEFDAREVHCCAIEDGLETLIVGSAVCRGHISFWCNRHIKVPTTDIFLLLHSGIGSGDD